MRFALLVLSPLLLACGPGDRFEGGRARSSLGIESSGRVLEDPKDAIKALALLRDVISGQSPAAPPKLLAGLEGRRVFVTVYPEGKRPVLATGMGADLSASLIQAAETARSKMGEKRADPMSWRLRLSVSQEHKRRHFKGEVWRPERMALGTYGIWMERSLEDGTLQQTWLTGADIVQKGLWRGMDVGGVPLPRLFSELAKRAGVKAIPEGSTYAELHTIDWADTANRKGALLLHRGYVEAKPINIQLVQRRALHGADYLARAIDENGRYDYRYIVPEDRSNASYNMLRHAGSTWSLLQAYQRFGDPAYLDGAERAIGFFLDRTEKREESGRWGDDYRFCSFQKYVKLGGNGLGLLMLAEHAEATGSREHLEVMQELGRFVRFMQEENGHFISYFDWDGPDKDVAIVPDDDSIYYPGEACFGLLKLYSLDPQPLWLETAKAGIDYMIYDRDKGKGERLIPHDHWLMYALSYLHAKVGGEDYLEHARLIERAIQQKQFQDDRKTRRFPDLLGGFYRPARFTPAGTRAEALVAGIDLERSTGGEWAGLETTALAALTFSTGAMYSPDSAYFAPRPTKAYGGIPEGHTAAYVQNDQVQHNISALMGMERHLASHNQQVLPGGPSWTGPAHEASRDEWTRWTGWRMQWGAGPTPDWEPNSEPRVGFDGGPARGSESLAEEEAGQVLP